MAEVTIGGQVWTVTLPNFKKLKAAWKYVAAVQQTDDPMESVDAILGVISVGSSTAVTVDELEEALTPAEMPALREFINELMIEIGLAKKAEDADPLADPAPADQSIGQIEASTDSSTSSLPITDGPQP